MHRFQRFHFYFYIHRFSNSKHCHTLSLDLEKMKNNFTFCCNCDLHYRIFHTETTLSNFFQHPSSLSSTFCDEQSELSSTIFHHYSQKPVPPAHRSASQCYETSLLRFREAPLVVLVHVIEGRDVEGLLEGEVKRLGTARAAFTPRQHVSMAFKPWRIGDVGDDGFHLGISGIIAEIKGDGIEAVAEITAIGQHANRSIGSHAMLLLDPLADCRI